MTGEEKIDQLTDAIIEIVENEHGKQDHPDDPPWDPIAAGIQIRRTIRDSCSELWEESAAEVNCVKAIDLLRAVWARLMCAPELNMSNYTEDEVAELNAAVCEVVCAMDSSDLALCVKREVP